MAEEKKEQQEQQGQVEDPAVETSAEVTSPIPPEQDEIDAIRNAPELVEVRGIGLKVCAVPMDELPELQKKLMAIDGMSPEPGEIVSDEAVLAMAEVAHMGLKQHHPNLTVERLKKMPIGCFPPILMATLNLNDFFAEMKTVLAASEAAAEMRSRSG